MSGIRSTMKRFRSWVTRKEPPSGPGPGGSPLNNNFEQARATAEFHRAQGSVGPHF